MMSYEEVRERLKQGQSLMWIPRSISKAPAIPDRYCKRPELLRDLWIGYANGPISSMTKLGTEGEEHAFGNGTYHTTSEGIVFVSWNKEQHKEAKQDTDAASFRHNHGPKK
jgi:hypothetical protein